MSYYFSIIGTQDNPLFEHEFGTFRHSGDGLARFPAGDGLGMPAAGQTGGLPSPTARQMNQLIVHASLDVLEEEQWKGGNMFLKHIDSFRSSHVYGFLTGANTKFLLLFNPDTHPRVSASASATHTHPVTTAAIAASAESGSTTGSSTGLTGGSGVGGSSGAGNGGGGIGGAGTGVVGSTSGAASSGTFNPTSAAAEEPIKSFFMDVYDLWLKTTMNPFYLPNMPIRSQVFRTRVAAAAKRYL